LACCWPEASQTGKRDMLVCESCIVWWKQLKVNGEEINLEATGCSSLLALLNYLNIEPESVAIEHNSQIQERSRWSSIPLAGNDIIEIIHFVGGG
jgi:sulfur carrier protein